MQHDAQPLTRFVILNAPRTGSNMLCTVLNSHPEILCHHEIFNPHVVGYARHLQDSTFHLGTIEERERDPVEFLTRVWASPLGRRAVGFKLCWRQNELILRTVLGDGDVKKIVLTRKNRIKSFVSLLRARQTGEWVIYRGSEVLKEHHKVRVEPEEFFQTIAYNAEYYAEIERALQSTGQTSLWLSYEELFTDEQRRRVLRFLGVSADEAPSLKEETLRLTRRQLPELVSNFADLEAALRGTEFEAELYS